MNLFIKIGFLSISFCLFTSSSFAGLEDKHPSSYTRSPQDHLKAPCSRGPDIDPDDTKPYVEYDKDIKPWKEVVPGVNLGGFCKNAQCKAKTSYVYMPVGMVEYLIRNGKYAKEPRCPECGAEFKVDGWGFSECLFKITAKKPSGTVCSRAWKRAKENFYLISIPDVGKAHYTRVTIQYLPENSAIPEDSDDEL